ncbi:MAG TPA: CDP-diacylglycerol--serine O-phosphatidyltransferase [Lachnospiraceae bacterium]|nr:CDP-diacylglycerol--serine O-phosphatidyltransferase [Lachnospiraceae bacterium]
MIGFYDYTVILTYISLFISVFGMIQAFGGGFRTAILCLALSGLCDMFDGKIARTKKNRTDDEKLFGIQIDSLCDVICFGIFPAMICFLAGVRGVIGSLLVGYYCVCSVIRLAFFNVLETNRQAHESGANKYYHGLPITSMAVILPLIFLLQAAVTSFVFIIVLHFALFIVGTLFIIDFKLRKPNNVELFFLVAVVSSAVLIILIFSRYHVPKFRFLEMPLWPVIKKLFGTE